MQKLINNLRQEKIIYKELLVIYFVLSLLKMF